MRLLEKIFGLRRKDLVLVRILGYLLIYFVLFYLSMDYFLIPILVILVLTVIAIRREKSLVGRKNNYFSKDNLFFRFGERINQLNFTVRNDKFLSNVEANDLMRELEEFLVNRIEKEIDSRIEHGSHKSEIINVVDSKRKKDEKTFVKFSFTGERGSALTHFILFEFIGRYTIIHFDTYFKGIPFWYNQLDFVLRSPFYIWWWCIPYLRAEYSILAKVSKGATNSFEDYDLDSYRVASKYSILDAIRDFLKEHKLLTEELKAIIFNQLVFNNNVHGDQVSGNQIKIIGDENTLDTEQKN